MPFKQFLLDYYFQGLVFEASYTRLYFTVLLKKKKIEIY